MSFTRFRKCHRRCSGGSVEIDVGCMARVVRSTFSSKPFAASIWNVNGAATVFYSRIQSPVGPLLLAATEAGLCYLQFERGKLFHTAAGEGWVESGAALRPYTEQLCAYFRGQLREFTCHLDLQGTAFQKKCWEALRTIPYGATCSYADLACKVGSPRAFRAVGQANHQNPIAIIVPCHRVIGADGTLTGYGGGLSIKEELLRLEGAAVQPVFRF
jgi:methylated-DNA-[protein]-cysteine S-methyltransferase